MTTTADDILTKTEEKMRKAIAATQNELATVRTGRANPMMLDRVQLDYYGTPTALKQMANISVQEGTTLVIQPYDRSQLGDIERAISKSDLNLPPNNDGQVIRLNIPPLNEERRKEMVKSIKKMGEDGKVAIRNIRRDATADIDKLKKAENLPEDEVKLRQDKVQKLTDKYVAQLDTMMSDKEKELMQV